MKLARAPAPGTRAEWLVQPRRLFESGQIERREGSGGLLGAGANRGGGSNQYVDYAASKGGIDVLTIGLAKEVVDEGIRVNTVRPGITRTDIHASGGQPDRADRLAPEIPMKRPGEPEEIANAIAWLCSGEASFVNGMVMPIDGGGAGRLW